MTKNIVIATFISSILGFAMIGGALYWQLGAAKQQDSAKSSSGDVSSLANRSFTLQELARYDGKDGNQCLVAVMATCTS